MAELSSRFRAQEHVFCGMIVVVELIACGRGLLATTEHGIFEATVEFGIVLKMFGSIVI